MMGPGTKVNSRIVNSQVKENYSIPQEKSATQGNSKMERRMVSANTSTRKERLCILVITKKARDMAKGTATRLMETLSMTENGTLISTTAKGLCSSLKTR